MTVKKKRSFRACSLARLKELGYEADDCDRQIPGSKWWKDLHGFGDAHAFDVDEVLIVQYCAVGDFQRRMKKCLDSPVAKLWVAGAGRALEVWGWYDFTRYRRQRLEPEDFG